MFGKEVKLVLNKAFSTIRWLGLGKKHRSFHGYLYHCYFHSYHNSVFFFDTRLSLGVVFKAEEIVSGCMVEAKEELLCVSFSLSLC